MQTRRGSRTICVDFNDRDHYARCVGDKTLYRQHLEAKFAEHPELFPPEMRRGFTFHDERTSTKQELVICRIRMTQQPKDAYQIRPTLVMPYMVAKTDDVEKGLYLRQWGVPFEGLAYVFGRDAMFWHRVTVSLGRSSVVGTTIKSPAKLPEHLVADEKHTWLGGEKAYVATTVAMGCILGAQVSMSASCAALAESYGEFAKEAWQLDPGYEPKTVCLDPWPPARNAWQKLFPGVAIVLCFLHSILKIGKIKAAPERLRERLIGRSWQAYAASTKQQFAQRMRRLREWAAGNISPGPLLDAVAAMSAKVASFKLAYDFDNPHRTTNAVDRMNDLQDRLLYSMRYFHGNLRTATLAMRSMALMWNFHPYGLRARPEARWRSSPFSELNDFSYHDNWLKNLSLASSMGGWRSHPTLMGGH